MDYHPVAISLRDGQRYWSCGACGFERIAQDTPQDIAASQAHAKTDCPWLKAGKPSTWPLTALVQTMAMALILCTLGLWVAMLRAGVVAN